MAVNEIPPSVVADGNIKVIWVPTLADPAKPQVTELTGASIVDLSCYFTKDGLNRGGDEQTVSDERLCSVQVYARPGTYSDTLDVIYVYNPQTDSLDTNAAFQTLKHLTEGYFVFRYGLPYAAAIAADQVVDVVPVACGRQRKQAPEANSVLKLAQQMHIISEVHDDVKIVA